MQSKIGNGMEEREIRLGQIETSREAKDMSEPLKKDRELVIPGDEIIRSMDYLPGKNCFREGDSIYAKRLGLVSIDRRVISVIPISGVYIPKVGDMVLGEVIDIQNNGWVVDIKSVNEAFLPLSGVREFIDTTKTDLSNIYGFGDVIYAKVSSTGSTSVHLSMQDSRARKLKSGRVLKMSPAKVPRLIGKEGSMINLIKNITRCSISIGQNGMVWFEGENEDGVVDAVRLIEREAITDGLTDKVSKLLGGGEDGKAKQ
jgi:exosome complex component RRP4